MLVPALSARTRISEPEVRAACMGEGQCGEVRAPPPRDAGGARRGRAAPPMGLPSVPHDGETDARRLRRNNAKALRLAIEQSECEAKAPPPEKALQKQDVRDFVVILLEILTGR